MKNATDIRDAFWNVFCVEGKPREFRNGRPIAAEVKAAFASFVAYGVNNGTISPELAKVAAL